MSRTPQQDHALKLSRALRCNLFATMDFSEAYEYANAIAKASDNPAAVMTAVHVLMNSIGKEVERTLLK